MNTQLEAIVAYLAGQDDEGTAVVRLGMQDADSDARRLLAHAEGLTRGLFAEATLQRLGLPAAAPVWPEDARPSRPALVWQAVPWLIALFALMGLAAQWGTMLGQRRPADPGAFDEEDALPLAVAHLRDDCRKERQQIEQLRQETRRLLNELADAREQLRGRRERTPQSPPVVPKATRPVAEPPIVLTRPGLRTEREKALQAKLDAAQAEIERRKKAPSVRVISVRDKALTADLQQARRENEGLRKDLAAAKVLARAEAERRRTATDELRGKLRKAETEGKRFKGVADDLRARLSKAEAEVERLRKPAKGHTRPHGDKGRP